MSIADAVHTMVSPVASADESDADLVRVQLALFPQALIIELHDSGIRVLACREAVTDYRPDLLMKTPRGWPPGVNWGAVPGCYLPDEHNVAIATVVWSGVRQVPPTGVKHGSFNLVLHETMHADDYLANRLRSHNPHFLSARTSDLAALTDYQRQDGAAGMEESYAETAARHFGADPHFAAQCPDLCRFWNSIALPVEPGPATRLADHDADYIGTAELLDDGTIELDLRADDDEVAIGAHALFRVAPGSRTYEQIRGRQRRGWSSGTVLLKPF
ncbi:hypothetical protein [Sphingomonas sp. PAMC 26621]|uniref:hypothetical protein n=1 Tax=Sphingomonas sp. PAMC 26621 TaxID=1112213 RepID=UPI0002881729|nr:hypothetical protein [Sphingomonas sp. PAMC 26621]